MKIATSWSTDSDVEQALADALKCLDSQLGGATPDYLICNHSATYKASELAKGLQAYAPNTALHQTSSCLGAMTNAGFHSQNGHGLALFAIVDPAASFGVGMASLGEEPASAAIQAAEQALLQADRPGELPQMVWISSTPGQEEAVIAGLKALMGPNIAIAGGSAADNEVKGQWWLGGNGAIAQDAVVVSVLFPSCQIGFAFHSGYDPTQHAAVVSDAEGRIIHRLNDRPAAEVYNEWTQGLIQEQMETGGNILGLTTLAPLGRIADYIGKVPQYQLSHPDSVSASGSLSMFSNIATGDEFVLMQGSPETLTRRIARVASSARNSTALENPKVLGAMVIYCAGCMLTVTDRMNEVASILDESIEQAPFIGAFTFGEQGSFLQAGPKHGNLMISVMLFLEK